MTHCIVFVIGILIGLLFAKQYPIFDLCPVTKARHRWLRVETWCYGICVHAGEYQECENCHKRRITAYGFFNKYKLSRANHEIDVP